MEKLFSILGREIPAYDPDQDPTRGDQLVEWTQDVKNAKVLEAQSKVVENEYKSMLKRKKAEKRVQANGSHMAELLDSKVAKTEVKSENEDEQSQSKIENGSNHEVVKEEKKIPLEDSQIKDEGS